MRGGAAIVAAALALGLVSSVAGAQSAGPRAVRPAAPSRADSLLAHGRLAAAEDALYAASDARPRDPAARGALAAYLASRGRFAIALVLFDEAQRFGADPARIRLARAAILPYTGAAAGPETTVPLERSRVPGTLGHIPVRTARASAASLSATIDPNRSGVTLGVGVAARLDLGRDRVLRELWIGERRLTRLSVRVDSALAVDELRLGLDVLWPFEPLFDEAAGALTLGRRAAATAGSTQTPWILTFPGLLLVPRPGEAPVRVESQAGRALLGGRRWQIDPRQATIIVAAR